MHLWYPEVIAFIAVVVLTCGLYLTLEMLWHIGKHIATQWLNDDEPNHDYD